MFYKRAEFEMLKQGFNYHSHNSHFGCLLFIGTYYWRIHLGFTYSKAFKKLVWVFDVYTKDDDVRQMLYSSHLYTAECVADNYTRVIKTEIF